MSKISYAEAFEKNAIIKNLPLIYDGKKLPKGMSAKVVLVRVQYEKYVKEYEDLMQEVLKQLKKEGYDERAQAISKMEEVFHLKEAFEKWKPGQKDEEGNEINKPEKPSDEDLKDAEKTAETKDEFQKEHEELVAEYTKAREAKSKELVELTERKFTPEELDSIIEMLGIDGDMKIDDKTIKKEMFIDVIGSLFTE